MEGPRLIFLAGLDFFEFCIFDIECPDIIFLASAHLLLPTAAALYIPERLEVRYSLAQQERDDLIYEVNQNEFNQNLHFTQP
jgi:hypothetical protein